MDSLSSPFPMRQPRHERNVQLLDSSFLDDLYMCRGLIIVAFAGVSVFAAELQCQSCSVAVDLLPACKKECKLKISRFASVSTSANVDSTRQSKIQNTTRYQKPLAFHDGSFLFIRTKRVESGTGNLETEDGDGLAPFFVSIIFLARFFSDDYRQGTRKVFDGNNSTCERFSQTK